MALNLQFLGPPQLILENEPVNVNRRSIVALLAYLAVNVEGKNSQKHTREYLSAILWPDYSQAKAYTNLRHTVWEIQRLFGPGWLTTSRDTISLNTQTDIWVDVHQFEGLCLQSSSQSDVLSRISLLAEAVKLYRNHFLTGFSLREGTTFNEWAFVKSKDIQNKLLGILTALCEDYCALGQANRAVPFAQQLIALDPLNESAHRRLMEIYLQTEQHNAALKQYQALQRTLRKEFNLDPQPETRQLYKRILKRDLKPIQLKQEVITPKHNLPAQHSTFIGRDGEKAKIAHLLETNHFVTLAGVGGIGKTSLAVQVGQKVLKNYPDGVWFVTFDSLSDPALVPQTVAAVLGIRDGAHHSMIDALINRLHEKTILLIFDNCEHLLGACRQLIKPLLQNCDNLKILVTSREILDLEGELIFYLSSLSTPEYQEISFEKLNKYESIQLFTERAALASPSFSLTRENAKTIIDICNRVDGIPLAIELAAARVNVLQVEEILEQLRVSFRLPANDSQAILPRHQTLQLSMDWSWGLLDESEQVFLRQLSVFAGGWTLDSALAVCDGNVLGLTRSLEKKSLLVVGQEAGHMTRYRLHEIVRQYAREKLAESGEEEIIRTRHLHCFLSLSEQAILGRQGPSQLVWYGRVMEDRDNFRAALELTRQTRDVESGLYLFGRLKYLWMNLDMQEGVRWLNYFLQDPQSNSYGLARARAQALLTQGELLNDLNRLSEAYKIFQECLALFRACGDISGEIDSLHLLAHELFVLGDRQRSMEIAHQALERSQSQGDLVREGRSLYRLGRYDPDSTRSFTYLEQAILVSRQAKNWLGLSTCLGTAGERAMHDGNIKLAENYVKEAVLLCRQVNDKFNLCTHLQNYGRIEFAQGEVEKAFVHLRESIEICRERGHRMVYLWSRSHLGYFTLWHGEIAKARDIFSETMQEFLNDKIEIGVVFNVEGMAGLYVAVGKAEYAARLIGWADATRQKISDLRSFFEQADVDKIIAACTIKLGEGAFLDAYDECQNMTLDEAVAYALGENPKASPI
jgi:predicted ATPase/DNA-binding SARP family transcriptional activator